MQENIILIIGGIISMALCYVLACLLTEKCCGRKKTRKNKHKI
jgi:amino acid permease